jgi:hypothetical protein
MQRRKRGRQKANLSGVQVSRPIDEKNADPPRARERPIARRRPVRRKTLRKTHRSVVGVDGLNDGKGREMLVLFGNQRKRVAPINRPRVVGRIGKHADLSARSDGKLGEQVARRKNRRGRRIKIPADDLL